MTYVTVKQTRTVVYKVQGDASTEQAKACVLARLEAGMPLDIVSDVTTTDSVELSNTEPMEAKAAKDADATVVPA